ncbi:hypothetical protein QFZ79_003752 [Arthrobacter sp. V4I6]|nr:hypothetical protein [Arthrobacter sp. V1I7]MDQ0855641.1 hypothetical protein [Arthrobacter sp. V4I6]
MCGTAWGIIGDRELSGWDEIVVPVNFLGLLQLGQQGYERTKYGRHELPAEVHLF